MYSDNNRPGHSQGQPGAAAHPPAEPAAAAHVPRLELVTKAHCHLCDDARAVVAGVAAGLGLSWQEVSIDGDDGLTRRYGEEIPVVLVDGIPRDFWHIDPVRLHAVLVRTMAQR